MVQPHEAGTPAPKSPQELLARYLERQTAAHAAGFGHCAAEGEVEPYDAVPARPIDARIAWTEAADAVILDSSLEKMDEFLHIGQRMRRIALQSAVGGMALSIGGMFIAAAGFLPPVAGAIIQEVIDVAVVFNALRMAIPPGRLTDF